MAKYDIIIHTMDENRKMLIVDDEKAMCDILHDIFSRRGFDVTIATSGFHALTLIKTEPFYVILLDIRMPDLDGYEVLKEMARLNIKPHVIMITAFDDCDTRKTFSKLGAYGFVSKPVNFKEIRADRKIAQIILERNHEK